MIIEKINLSDSKTYHIEDMTVTSGKPVVIDIKYSKITGLGERYNKINNIGEKLENVVEEQFCYQNKTTYFPLPFFIMDNGYGVFIDTDKEISYDFGEKICIDFAYDESDTIYILKGSCKEIISDFISLTGKQKKAPKWIFGPWLSAHRWNCREDIEDVLDKIEKKGFPVNVIVIEQWSDEATFYIFNGAKYPDKEVLDYEDFDFTDCKWGDPKDLIEKIHDKGIKLLLWQCPIVKYMPDNEPENLRQQHDWDYCVKENLVIKGKENCYTIPEGRWFGGSMVPDYSNEKMKEWWFGNRKYLLDIGVDGFKTDGGEFIHGYAKDCQGNRENVLKNTYPVEYVKAYDEFLGDERVSFSRAGYLSQQTYTLQWAGDQKSTWEELQSVYKAGINVSLCGQINWGFDIAGFSGELPSTELYIRATQFAVFSPIMQVHSEPVGGQFSLINKERIHNNERTPWNIAGTNNDILEYIKKLYLLRMNLLPYIYSEYLKALEEKSTLLKHMNVEYEGEYNEEQYMFGKLLIAPVLHNDAEKVEIKFPEGKWRNIITEESADGNIKYENISIMDIFAFAKEGEALVTKEKEIIPERTSNDIQCEKVHFRLFGNNGKYRFLDDENDFTVIWENNQVEIEGTNKINITYEIIF